MRRWIGLLAAVLALSASVMCVSAAGGCHGKRVCHSPQRCETVCGGYADADRNGVCDNCGAARAGCQGLKGAETVCGGYADADGNGICDNCGAARAGCQGLKTSGGACGLRRGGCHRGR